MMMTLHEAIVKILTDANDRGLTANEIVTENKRYEFYRKDDGDFPDTDQIHARVNKYPELFRKESPADGNQLIFLNSIKTVPITCESILPIWWILLWLFCAGTFILAILLSTFAALINESSDRLLFGFPLYVWALLGLIPVELVAVKLTLAKKYKRYFVRLIKDSTANQFTINNISVASIWWSMFWRAILVSSVINGLDGWIASTLNVPAGSNIITSITLAAVIHIWALKAALSKSHGGYSVALIKVESGQN